MTSIKENVIKLTDYPFIFSLAGSLFVMIFNKKLYSSHTPFNELVPVLIIIGIIGTIISIIDPLGRIVKKIILFRKVSLEVKYHSFLDSPDISEIINKLTLDFALKPPQVNIKRSLNTNWITYEIDKLVSTFYFLIILFFLTIIIANPDSYKVYVELIGMNLNSTNTSIESKDSISHSTSNTNNSENSINNIELYSELRIPVLIIFLISLIGIFYIFLKYCLNLRSKLLVVAEYFGLNNIIDLYLYENSLREELTDLNKNFTDSLNVYDWEMAGFWLERIKKVLERSKGRDPN